MDKEKQIEEMAIVIDEYTEPLSARDIHKADFSERLAEALYDEGFGKRSVGEWIKDNTSKFNHRYNCSVCDYRFLGIPTPHCPNCGAKMGDGAE